MISFDVYAMPGPQGSKKVLGHMKPKPGRKHGRVLLGESSAKVKPWREAVVYAARQAMADLPEAFVVWGEDGAVTFPLDGPLVLRLVFTLPKPKSAPKRRTTFPDRKPDLSKLARSTEDALTDAGLIADDARIIGYERLWKVYPREDPDALDVPGCRIVVRRFMGT